MSWSAGAIVGTIDLDTGGFASGFLEVESLMHTFPSIVTAFMAGPLTGLAETAREALGMISQAFKFLDDAIEGTAKNDAKIKHLAANIGVTTETLSRMGFAAERSGKTVDDMASAFTFLGRNLGEAMEKGGDAARQFTDYGIAFTDTAGAARPLGDIMMDVADSMMSCADQGERAQIALRLLGRGGSDMVETLSMGSEALRGMGHEADVLGVTVSRSSANSAAAVMRLEHSMNAAWEGIKAAIGRPVIESLTPAMEELYRSVEAHMPEIRANIKSSVDEIMVSVKEAFKWTHEHWPEIINDLHNVVSVCESLARAIKELPSFEIPLWSNRMPISDAVDAHVKQADLAKYAYGKSNATDRNGNPLPPITINVAAPKPGDSIGQVLYEVSRKIKEESDRQSKRDGGVQTKHALEQGF